MIFLPAKFFCQSNGLFHPKDLFAAFHDLAFQGITQHPFGIPDSSAGDATFQSRLVDVLAEHSLSSGKQGADQVFGLLGLGFPLRLDAGQHFICGNVVLADPAETALIPRRECQRHARRSKGTFLMGQDAGLVDPLLAVRTLLVYLAVQFIENQFIYPRGVGKSVGLSPRYTLVAAMIGGKLFGILFFIPLTAVVLELVKEYAFRRLRTKETLQ